LRRQPTVNLGNLLLSLSDAMDLASPKLAQHQQRTAFVAWQIGKIAGLEDLAIEELFIAALLHDIGALSVEEKVALRQATIEESEVEDVEGHCIRGETLLEKVSWLEPAAKIVRFHHRDWTQWDQPIDDPTVLRSQILLLADYLERLVIRDRYILHQEEELVSRVKSMSGNSFHPDVVDCFINAADREEFWLDLVNPRLYSLLLHQGPYKRLHVDLLGMTSLTELFRNIIDFRSRFTATHSAGVAACCVVLSKIFGLTETEVQLMEIAGNLHDLGKLAIQNSILEKRGKLTKEEFYIIKSHTYFTYSVLNTIGGLEQISEWSAFHHEKLDGSGYPFHCTASALDTGARILAIADLFVAIAEDRPYRKGMSQKEITRILKEFSNRQLLDKNITCLLLDNYDKINCYVKEVQSSVLDFYKNQFSVPD